VGLTVLVEVDRVLSSGAVADGHQTEAVCTDAGIGLAVGDFDAVLLQLAGSQLPAGRTHRADTAGSSVAVDPERIDVGLAGL